MEIRISCEQDGLCVRQILKNELHLSVKMIKYLKYRPMGICVNGECVTVRRVLCTGDVLTLATEDSESSPALTPVDFPLEVVYEDADVVLPNKPADMPTHPSHDHYFDTVANALAFRYAQESRAFVFRPINRLDRNTSGILLIARNKRAAGNLTQAMQSGMIHKTYLAVIEGELQEGCGVIDACLHRTAESIIVREVCMPTVPDADRARTEYRVLAVGNGHSLVEVTPLTGRTHQIRVHFAYSGHPLVSDDLYGTPSPLIARHALHAYRLVFPHPVTGARMELCAPLAEDMRALIRDCFPSYSLERSLS